jgi:hypothetical protein
VAVRRLTVIFWTCLLVAGPLSGALVLLDATTARAGTATCTTDSSTSYCEQLDTGTQGTTFLDGFGIAELAGVTVFAGLLGLHMVRRVLKAGGWLD